MEFNLLCVFVLVKKHGYVIQVFPLCLPDSCCQSDKDRYHQNVIQFVQVIPSQQLPFDFNARGFHSRHY